ncbi:MarR family transcriptional regulator [Pseudonocardia sp. RS11V-5]|uniref:MarR family winged helix-turn-helix transcriptional regulator n=1 Tax=Pseudonocardia terrae TaxID=2905831 RepID=UPI001E4518DB|nr:MarR family transcriptional regulator [Pseudonocardia terrae]MCE3550351.1 MarR family transcriptional regulator [Pseudonocardia terrae]
MTANRDAIDEIQAVWSARRPDLDTAPIAVAGRILRAARFLQQAADDWLADAGVTRAEFDVLSQLRRNDAPLRPGDLTAGVVGSPAATTKRLHKLTAAGLVTRTPDPDDARAARVALTGAGERLVDEVLPRQVAAEAELLEVFTPAERESLAALLRTALLAWEP